MNSPGQIFFQFYRGLFTLLFCFSTGCAVGPNYVRPEVALPAAWLGSLGEVPQSPQESVTLEKWWSCFEDPKLESLLYRSLAANNDLGTARARVAQARAQRRIARAGLFPSLDLNADYRRSEARSGEASQRGGVFTPSTQSPQDNFSAGFDAAWELDIFGGNRRATEVAAAEEDFAIEQLRDVQVSLLAEVATHYVSLRGFQQRLSVARRNLELQQRNAEIARKRYDSGFASGADAANADAQRATTAARIPELESSVRGELFTLALLIGREPGALISELGDPSRVPLPSAPAPIGFPADILSRRPDVRSAEAELHAQTARVGVATADLFPRLTLSGSVALEGDRVKALGYWENHLWSLAGNLAAPIFDAGRRRANVEAEEAGTQAAVFTFHQAVLTALNEVETSLSALQSERARRPDLEESVTQNRKALKAASDSYTSGSSDFLGVLTAERSLFDSEDALISSNITEALQFISVYKALGGGWADESAQVALQ